MAAKVCIEDLHRLPREVITSWSDVTVLLGYHSDKVAQQSFCDECREKLLGEENTCYLCGTKYYDKDYKGEREDIDTNPSTNDLKNMMGIGKQEFSKEEVRRLGADV
jgi:hypothetical protein